MVVKNLPVSAEDARDMGSIPGLGKSPGVGNGTYFSILAWKIPWTEELGGLQSRGLQKVWQDWVTDHACTCCQLAYFIGSLESLSSPIWDWTWALSSESAKSWPLNCWGIPSTCLFLVFQGLVAEGMILECKFFRIRLIKISCLRDC